MRAENSGLVQTVRDAADHLRRAEAEVARLKDRVEQRDRQIAVYNSGGFADADALAESVIELKARIAALEAERDALKAERDAAFALLRVCKDSVHPDTKIVIEALIT